MGEVRRPNPQIHGEKKGLEDRGGKQMGERVGMGCLSPRDADDATRAPGALFLLEKVEVVSKGEMDGSRGGSQLS